MGCDNHRIVCKDNCVCCEVKEIDQMQKEAILESNCLTCTGKKLGKNREGTIGFNTRPFVLYLPNGEPFEIFINDDLTLTSFIFRVEDVDENCCATCRALLPNNATSSNTSCHDDDICVATNFCCTVDLKEFVAIQCLQDCRIDNIPTTTNL